LDPFTVLSETLGPDTVGTLTGYLTQPLSTLGDNAIIYIVIVLSIASSAYSIPIFAYQPIFSQFLSTNDGSTSVATSVTENGTFTQFSGTGFVSLNAILESYKPLGKVVGIFPITLEIYTQGSFTSTDDQFTLAWVQIV
jgi:hypothetical protein